MGRASSPIASLILTAATVLAAGSASLADELPPSGKAPKAAKKKGGAQAEGSTAETVLKWDDQDLTEVKVVQRLMRLNKSGQWSADRLPKLSQMAIDTGRKNLVLLGYFYLALTAGREGNSADALEKLKKAVSLGYGNVTEIVEADAFADLQENPEFKAIVEELTRKVEKEARARFSARTDAAFAASKEAPASWLPGLTLASGGPFWTEGPMLVIVTRAHHEGFEKLLGKLKEIPADRLSRTSLRVLFYQGDPGNAQRAAQAREYAGRVATKLGVPLEHAVIGRKEYKDLDALMLALHEKVAARSAPAAAEEEGAPDTTKGPLNVYPLILGFFGGKGSFHHAICGVPEPWQIEYAAGKLIEAVPPEPPKEPEPVKEPEPSREPPPPAKDAERPAADPPAEKPAGAAPEKPADPPPTPPPANGGAEAETPPEKPEVKEG